MLYLFFLPWLVLWDWLHRQKSILLPTVLKFLLFRVLMVQGNMQQEVPVELYTL